MKTSAMKTSIDEAGRILLPQRVQSHLGVKPGDELALQEVNGQWFLKPITAAADPHDDDLNWEKLDYHHMPPRPSGQVTVRIEQRGKLMPMASRSTVIDNRIDGESEAAAAAGAVLRHMERFLAEPVSVLRFEKRERPAR